MRLLGNPQAGLKCIHIAGTKGKGSVATMLAYVLAESGLRVGLFTSPHLYSFRERIRILGDEALSNPYTQDGVEVLSDQTCNFLAYQSMDINCDNKISIQDVVYIVNYLYNDGESPCIPQVADKNCTGNPSIADAICTIQYLFREGPVSCCPPF